MNVVLLIPAYNPGDQLIEYVRELTKEPFVARIVVNDGSAPRCKPIFDELTKFPNVTVLHHAINLGKGMALKTGINHAYVAYPSALGVVTADADGQHHINDVLAVAAKLIENPTSLILGVREFDGHVPFRSRLGNSLTKVLYRLLVGGKLSDTQSGLRGIPRDLTTKLLKLPSNGYEFELDMLLLCQHNQRPVVEHGIRTIYLHENQSSHFNPLLDSMKIYFVLFRAVIVSLMTVVIDTAIFIPLYYSSYRLFASHFTARLVGMLFQYTVAKKFVFYSDKRNAVAFPEFALLVFIMGLVSFEIIQFLSVRYMISVPQAKIIAEAAIYLISFTMQRDFIFTSRKNVETRPS